MASTNPMHVASPANKSTRQQRNHPNGDVEEGAKRQKRHGNGTATSPTSVADNAGVLPQQEEEKIWQEGNRNAFFCGVLEKLGFTGRDGKVKWGPYKHPSIPDNEMLGEQRDVRKFMVKNGIPNIENLENEEERMKLETSVKFAFVDKAHWRAPRVAQSDEAIIKGLLKDLNFTFVDQPEGNVILAPGVTEPVEEGEDSFKSLEDARAYIRATENLCSWRTCMVALSNIRIWAAKSERPLPTFVAADNTAKPAAAATPHGVAEPAATAEANQQDGGQLDDDTSAANLATAATPHGGIEPAAAAEANQQDGGQLDDDTPAANQAAAATLHGVVEPAAAVEANQQDGPLVNVAQLENAKKTYRSLWLDIKMKREWRDATRTKMGLPTDAEDDLAVPGIPTEDKPIQEQIECLKVELVDIKSENKILRHHRREAL